MSRIKKGSRVLEKAEIRLAGVQSINSRLDLGNGLSVEEFNALIEDTRAKLLAYNTALSAIDKARSDVLELEQKLGDYSEHILLGVATRFGKKSDEYEMAGGVRKDRRKRRRSTPAINGVLALAQSA
jgi:hypothetical protein